MNPRVAAIIPAGGTGSRMGNVRKQFMEIAGRPALQYSIDAFASIPEVEWIVIALPIEDVHRPPSWLDASRVRIVPGGAERTHSVFNALQAVPDEAEIVTVHDAARPLVTPALIRATIVAAAKGVGAIAAVRVADTLKVVGNGGVVEGTADRSRLYQAQTPQTFPREVLAEAHRRAHEDGYVATDDAGLLEHYGLMKIVIVPGARDNIKVTTPEDIALAEVLLKARS